MCRVIVNSTPLICLGRVGRLELLRAVFGTIAIPQAVYDEVCKKPAAACALLKSEPEWIKVITVHDDSAKKWFPVALHDGEIEVMLLASELGKKQVVIDDLPARRHALRLFGKSHVMGTLGVLIIAKRKGLIENVSTIIEELKQAGIRYSDAAVQNAIQMAGESLLPENDA